MAFSFKLPKLGSSGKKLSSAAMTFSDEMPKPTKAGPKVAMPGFLAKQPVGPIGLRYRTSRNLGQIGPCLRFGQVHGAGPAPLQQRRDV